MTRNLAGIGLLFLLTATGNISAQSYPSRPVRVIAAQSAGSALDTITRIVANKLQKALAAPDVKEQYALQGALPQGSEGPEDFGRYFRADYDRIVKLVKIAGIKPE